MTTTPTGLPPRLDGLDGLLAAVSGERMAASVAVLAGDGFAWRWVGTAGLFDPFGHAGAAAGLLLRAGFDPDDWQYTMFAGPNPGPVPVLTLDPGGDRAVPTRARTAPHMFLHRGSLW